MEDFERILVLFENIWDNTLPSVGCTAEVLYRR
jgi:hypothetical protein